jgi:phospholipase C
MNNQLPRIKHVVQLMLENRSFDQMLGFLYAGKRTPQGSPFEGLTGDEKNSDGAGGKVPIAQIKATDPHPYFMPGADPGEGFYNTNLQLFSTMHPDRSQPPNNDGFVVNFGNAIASDAAAGYKDTIPGTKASGIMSMYTPDLLPVMSGLAKGFAVCDLWFASAPTQTIPNRAFGAAGTSQGRLDNKVKTFTCDSIFGRLTNANRDWAIYGYSGSPLMRTDFPDVLHAPPQHFGKFKDFVARAKAGKLPAYTFLEPDFGMHGNSQHPNYDVSAGEQFIRSVYYALRQNEAGWGSTLLIVTYDEHGGNFDHVAPPFGATPPDGTVGEFDNFDFRRFGVRVPALLVSPLIAAGTVFRPAQGTLDHTSVLKTLEELLGLQALTARDRNAPSLGDALTLARPRTDDPLQGVVAPHAALSPLKGAAPSELELVHARRVWQLPIADAHAQFPRHATEPTFRTSAEVQDYIESRMARWDVHLASRRSASGASSPYVKRRANVVSANPHAISTLKRPKGEPKHKAAPRRTARAGEGGQAGQLAPGFAPDPRLDLTFHGGKTLPSLSYLNVYLGNWDGSDSNSIDGALKAALTDPGLNAVINQYFDGAHGVQTTFLGSAKNGDPLPETFTRDSVSATLDAIREGTSIAGIGGIDFSSTIVCLLLPKGVILDDTTTSSTGVGFLEDDDKASSLEGLGGYHGSHDSSDGTTVYFAVAVYSEGQNGIPAFDASWKNVVATLYHELCEARTDPDVEDVNRTGNSSLLGWYGDARGAGEIGDIPINEAGQNLSSVFVEVPLQAGGTAPIQLMWSNAVHGPGTP